VARLQRLPVAEAVDIVRQTARAVGAANDRGIVHRDLKPENLLMVRDPADPTREMVKVVDFGVAKLIERDIGEEVETHTGRLVGTPIYMSPEQCRGLREIDRRTDVYALGVVLYHMLCGRPPFQSEATGDILMMHVSLPPEPPRSIDAAIPAWLE